MSDRPCPECGLWPGADPRVTYAQGPPPGSWQPQPQPLKGLGTAYRICAGGGAGLVAVASIVMAAGSVNDPASSSAVAALPLFALAGLLAAAGEILRRAWTFRAIRNATTWAQEPLRFNPGWAWWPLLIAVVLGLVVGMGLGFVMAGVALENSRSSFFPSPAMMFALVAIGALVQAIPLTLDKMVLNDLWRLSDPANAAGTFRGGKVDMSLNLWFGLTLAASFGGTSGSFTLDFSTPSVATGAWAAITIVGALVGLVATALLIRCSVLVERNQEQRKGMVSQAYVPALY